jgi:transcription-repair coupling factor (superfamily II helicase)
VFYVTPRIADLAELKSKITELAPNARLAVAHGQMSANELDVVMNDVYDGKCDILLSTSIIESGIDVPSANTMIINRSDRFGLAQLYQLRGRVGRGKVRAYAYFTIPYHGAMSAGAVRRLEVMQSLDTLGAGFTLASHDMDIRGFGNLVGDEQSGHVKEVGIELYQQMLSEAVAQARADAAMGVGEHVEVAQDWSPQLNLGLSIFIPEEYVEDLSLRLSLYRRASKLASEAEIESFAAELIDRFGRIPPEVEHLFTTISLKCLCKEAGIAKIDTGPKGAVLHFQVGAVKNPEALVGFINRHTKKMKMRPDNSVFYSAEWTNDAQKLADIKQLINNIKAL